MNQPSQLPEKVATLAGTRSMGALLASRAGAGPTLRIVLALAAVAAGVVAIFVLNAADLRVPTLRMAALAVFVGAPVYIVHALITGTRTAYLFEGGLIVTNRFSAKAITWPEVAGMTSGKAALDGVISARQTHVLQRTGGGKVVFHAGADDPIAGQVAERVRSAGRPVNA